MDKYSYICEYSITTGNRARGGYISEYSMTTGYKAINGNTQRQYVVDFGSYIIVKQVIVTCSGE